MNKRVLIGVLCLVIAIAGQLGWEFLGREKLLYTQVLTVNQDIEIGTEITRDMLATNKTINASSRSYRVSEEAIGEIIGKETTSYIPQGVELYPEYFEDPTLVVHEGEYVLSIPSSWLVARPQTLRRGDSLTFLTQEGINVATATVLYVKDGSNAEVTSDAERLTASSSVSVIEIIVSEEEAKLLTTIAGQDENNQFVLIYNKQ